MKLFARISREYDLKSRNDISDWLWHFGFLHYKPIVVATRYGYLEVVRYLYENGVDIHADNEYALRNAACYGHLKIVKYFHTHENGADIHVYNEGALRNAALHKHFDIVRYLHEHGANIQDAIDYAKRCGFKYEQKNLEKCLESYEKK